MEMLFVAYLMSGRKRWRVVPAPTELCRLWAKFDNVMPHARRKVLYTQDELTLLEVDQDLSDPALGHLTFESLGMNPMTVKEVYEELNSFSHREAEWSSPDSFPSLADHARYLRANPDPAKNLGLSRL
eukprot:gnl/Hemi2/2178_TR782_c0_g1_i1.p1 gnl/Hemi2/2178_TR782_c0_g1~~gnl/Hemi2/2178_TR782_c0_g1_i1.p1  ORF type:complete len:128 (-),score=26.49 gnl/Hemi2/2178_TR782_c0_g1_i1:85-468(-)